MTTSNEEYALRNFNLIPDFGGEQKRLLSTKCAGHFSFNFPSEYGGELQEKMAFGGEITVRNFKWT